MAGIDSLKERLLNDAKLKASAIENEALSKAKSILDEATNKAERIVEEFKEKAEREGKEKKERIISKAKMECRDMILKAKQEMIDNIFKLVVDKINNMDLESYRSLFKTLILNSVETGDEEIVLSQKDKDKFNQSFLYEINRELIAKGKAGNLKLSSETLNLNSGFILRRNGLEINCTIESLIRNLRDELEVELAKLLF
ncbi:V/A-type H+-transporting ATPase subunit E [Caloramator fervidus]|uniref:V-type proton ATPase subunit E n=1 Tax=Caloramator fervidus TaxID=29344 RepID=Q2EQR9_9CLOT|nr:V-type ATP synthase subunit E [Caloramator fervidus]ABD18896.1 NtpE [Caloramator fervidus DSM 5463]SEF72297.1 V/A-type H+-transporting ATPase subunit E [Caloramator fervidus]